MGDVCAARCRYRARRVCRHNDSIYERRCRGECSTMIQIPSSILREIYDHIEASYPHECCGLMVGTLSAGKYAVHTFRKCRNLNTERAHDRHELDPLCMLTVQREFENGAWDAIRIYLSHADHSSRPSARCCESWILSTKASATGCWSRAKTSGDSSTFS